MENPRVVTEFAFQVQSRTREEGIAAADRLAAAILLELGGEPWIMVDDDFKKVAPDTRLTIVDEQGFMYAGLRRYVFRGPLVGQTNAPSHDGFRTQRDQDETGQAAP